MGSLAIDYILNGFDCGGNEILDFNHGMLGTSKKGYAVNNIADIEPNANMKDRIPKSTWWLEEIRDINVLLCNCRVDDLSKSKDRIFSETYCHSAQNVDTAVVSGKVAAISGVGPPANSVRESSTFDSNA